MCLIDVCIYYANAHTYRIVHMVHTMDRQAAPTTMRTFSQYGRTLVKLDGKSPSQIVTSSSKCFMTMNDQNERINKNTHTHSNTKRWLLPLVLLSSSLPMPPSLFDAVVAAAVTITTLIQLLSNSI